MTEQAGSQPVHRLPEEMPEWKGVRRQRIIDAALAALKENDYDSIRISDVAQRAQVALSTLYRYFPSKEILYAVTLLDWSNRRPAPAPGDARNSAQERVRAWMHRILTAFERRPHYFRTITVLYASPDPEVAAVLAEIASSAQTTLTRELEVLGPGAAEDTATMVWALMHSMLRSVMYGERGMADVHRIVDGFIDLLSGQFADAAHG